MNIKTTIIHEHLYLLLTLGVFFLLLIFINPLNNAPTDDDFAYGWMVKNLHETGTYVLHEWSVANIFFQTYYGLIFVKIFGFSFIILRISTLLLVFFGIISFYYLCKEFNLNNRQSGILSILLVTSPLFLQFSFSYMSDVQFLCWFIISTFFYIKSFKNNNITILILAGFASSAAILTRQTGIVILPSLFFLWIFCKDRQEKASHYLIGLILPTIACLVQIYINYKNVTLISEFLIYENIQYLMDPISFAINTLWRINTVFNYLALFTLPLVLLLVPIFIVKLSGKYNNSNYRYNNFTLLLTCTSYFIGSSIYFGLVENLPIFIPNIDWHFNYLRQTNFEIKFIITSLTTSGAILYSTVILSRYITNLRIRRLQANEIYLILITLFLLLFVILYVQFADRYLINFLPFILIIIGVTFKNYLHKHFRAIISLILITMIFPIMETKNLLAKSEAYWSAGGYLLSQGVEHSDITSGSWTWDAYYNWNDYIYEIRDDWELEKFNPIEDFWDNRWPSRGKCTTYLITYKNENDTPDWQVLKVFEYNHNILSKKFVYAVRKKKNCM